MREWLIDGFRYDLWANRRWLPLVSGALQKIEQPLWPDEMPSDPQARMEEIFAHLLRAQRVWLSRLHPMIQTDGEAWLTEMNDAWIDLLTTRDLDEIVSYRNTKGIPFKHPVGKIAAHVVNHGTYHRGQLSALAASIGVEGPETDLFLWQMETSPLSA
jgi:uncharacterized damage-inducible protein DinB